MAFSGLAEEDNAWRHRESLKLKQNWHWAKNMDDKIGDKNKATVKQPSFPRKKSLNSRESPGKLATYSM